MMNAGSFIRSLRLHLGQEITDPMFSVRNDTEKTVEMQWTDFHWGDESRPE